MTDIPVFEDDALEAMAEELRASSADLLAAQQKAAQLREAILIRDVIGQAKGILIERHKVGDRQAFELLHAESKRARVRLYDVAIHLTQTGTLEHPES